MPYNANDTLRTKILDAILLSFDAMEASLPSGDPYGVAWSVVTREPLINGAPKGKLNALGIYGGTEKKKRVNFQITDVVIPCVIEFYVHKVPNENLTILVERMAGVVERRLEEEGTWGGLALDTTVTGSSSTVEGQYDNQGEGAVYFDVQFRHRAGDPREAC